MKTAITRTTPLEALPSMLRVPEVAAWCDVSPGVVYDSIRRGLLKSVTFGRIVRVPRSQLEAWLGTTAADSDSLRDVSSEGRR